MSEKEISGYEPQTTPMDMSEGARIASCVIALVLYISAVTGDGGLIAMFLRDSRMRTATNMFVMSHISAEFASALIGIFANVAVLTLPSSNSPRNSVVCTLSGIFINFFALAGYLSLVGISIDRYLAVVKKVHHQMSSCRVLGYIILIWTLAVLGSLPWYTIFTGSSRARYLAWVIQNCETPTRGRKWLSTGAGIATFLSIIVFYCLPAFIIIYTCFRTLCWTIKNRRRIQVARVLNVAISVNYSRSAFTVFLIIIFYYVCLLPTVVLIVLSERKYLPSEKFQGITSWYVCAKISLCFRSTCYPVIYVIRNPKCFQYFQNAFDKVLSWLQTLCFYCCILKGRNSSHNAVPAPYVIRISGSQISEAERDSNRNCANLHGTDAMFWSFQHKIAFADLTQIDS